MIKIAPSILAADPLRLYDDIQKVREAGCEWVHVDVMDAHFVPNLAYSADTVRKISDTLDIKTDVHLMMDNPEKMLDAFLDAGARCLTVHAEIPGDVPALLDRIRKRGRLAGVALKPGSPLEMINGYLDKTDLVLMMTVEPGFGGQKLDARVISKIRSLYDTGYQGEIEADGGIQEENLGLLTSNGLTMAVMGTAVFSQENMKAYVSRLKKIGAERRAELRNR